MKKILSLILAAILLVMPMCFESYASEETNYDDLVAPCYTHLSQISASLIEGSLGFVTCTSNAVSFKENITMVLTCALQRTDGTYAWENYKTKTETYTNGTVSNTIQKTWFAPANYAYRVKTTVTIKNASGVVVETASVNSKVLYK